MKQEALVNLLAPKKEGSINGQDFGGANALSRIIRINQVTIWTYVQCLYLEPETQAMIGNEKGKISLR